MKMVPQNKSYLSYKFLAKKIAFAVVLALGTLIFTSKKANAADMSTSMTTFLPLLTNYFQNTEKAKPPLGTKVGGVIGKTLEDFDADPNIGDQKPLRGVNGTMTLVGFGRIRDSRYTKCREIRVEHFNERSSRRVIDYHYICKGRSSRRWHHVKPKEINFDRRIATEDHASEDAQGWP